MEGTCVTDNVWTRWPSQEALGRQGISRPRRMLAWAVRMLVLGLLLWEAFDDHHVHGWGTVAAVGGITLAGALSWAFFRTTYQHRLLTSMVVVTLMLGLAVVAQSTGFREPALVIWCGCAISALERMPLVAALPVAALALAAF